MPAARIPAFLDGPPPPTPPAKGIHGGIDIRHAHTSQLRLHLHLPEAFAMLNIDMDGLHGGFLTTDENGHRLFALTTSGLTIVQSVNVPPGVGTLSPSSGPATGETALTIRGSGFQAGIQATLGGKFSGSYSPILTVNSSPSMLPSLHHEARLRC